MLKIDGSRSGGKKCANGIIKTNRDNDDEWINKTIDSIELDREKNMDLLLYLLSRVQLRARHTHTHTQERHAHTGYFLTSSTIQLIISN